MSEAFRNLLSASLSPEISQEQRQQVTEALLNIYQTPQSSLEIIQFLSSEPNSVLRHAASIGLKASLKKNWKSSIYQSQFREPIKAEIIKILANETERIIRHTIVQASKPIFKTDACEWPQLFEFVTNLARLDCSQINSIELALYLISYFSPYLSPVSLQENLPFFLELINFSYETKSQDVIDTACGLVAVLINQIDTNEGMQMIAPIFSKMLDIYSVSLSGNDQFAINVSDKVEFAFGKKDYPLPNELILSRLFAVVPQNPVLAYKAINKFVFICGKRLSNAYDTILQQTLTFATALFTDAPLEDNSDSMYVLEAVETISLAVKPRIFFPKLLSMLSTKSLQETIISAMAISRVISNSKEAVTKNISQLSKFIFDVLQINHICAKEVALDIIKEIATLFEEGKSNISSQFMPSIIQLLSLDQPGLMKHTLSTLRKLLECTDIDVNLINPVLQGLSKLLEPGHHVQTAQVFDVISALVFSAGEDVAPFVQTLFPLIVQTASIPEANDPGLKANSIEALSNILRFSNLSDELVNQALTLIIVSGQTNDFDIRGSVMISLSNILTNKIPQILNFVEPIQKLITIYINEEIKSDNEINQATQNYGGDDFDDDDDSEIESMFTANQNQINSITNTLLLIKNIYKLCPQLAPTDPTPWFKFSVDCMESLHDDLSVAATLAALYMLLKVANLLDPSGFLMKLKDNFDNEASAVVSCSFKVITRFMENNFPLSEEILKFVIGQGKLAFAGRLTCQEEDETAADNSLLTLSMQVNKFFAILATKAPAAFPINDYIDYGKRISGNSDEFEISQYIGVLRQLYINSGNGTTPGQFNLTSLQKKFIIKAFVENLKICDFSVLPEPLIAVKNVLERENDKILPSLQIILNFINHLFECQYEGQMHYWSTMTDAVSFLCSLIKLDINSFNTTYLSKIFYVLPVKGDEMEAENIYGTLLWLVTQTPVGSEIVNKFGPDLIRVLAQTLGLKEKALSLFKLSSQVLQGIIQILLNLLNQVPDANQILANSFTDQLSLSRCQQRLSIKQG